MANLFSVESGRLIAFIGKLHQLGVTAEEVEECLQDGDAAKRRILAFKNPEGLRVSSRINCDGVPYIPDGWEVEEHKKGGELEFDPTKVAFHLDDGQKDGRTIVGNELRNRLADKPVMNACVLDHLLANTTSSPRSGSATRAATPATSTSGARCTATRAAACASVASAGTAGGGAGTTAGSAAGGAARTRRRSS